MGRRRRQQRRHADAAPAVGGPSDGQTEDAVAGAGAETEAIAVAGAVAGGAGGDVNMCVCESARKTGEFSSSIRYSPRSPRNHRLGTRSCARRFAPVLARRRAQPCLDGVAALAVHTRTRTALARMRRRPPRRAYDASQDGGAPSRCVERWRRGAGPTLRRGGTLRSPAADGSRRPRQRRGPRAQRERGRRGARRPSSSRWRGCGGRGRLRRRWGGAVRDGDRSVVGAASRKSCAVPSGGGSVELVRDQEVEVRIERVPTLANARRPISKPNHDTMVEPALAAPLLTNVCRRPPRSRAGRR